MNREDVEAVEILCRETLRYINRAAKEKVTGDITFKSVVKKIEGGKYHILDSGGQTRKVKCCIPNVEIKVGQAVWVKMPRGNLQDIHICGIV